MREKIGRISRKAGAVFGLGIEIWGIRRIAARTAGG
jgi:hypothetical protein